MFLCSTLKEVRITTDTTIKTDDAASTTSTGKAGKPAKRHNKPSKCEHQ